MRVFAGYDHREVDGYEVFNSSLRRHASEQLTVIPLSSGGGPVGTNEFTFSRFRVPDLCGYRGRALFMDGSDMLVRDDVAKLFALFDASYAVQVVKHAPYSTRHKQKYVGTQMQCPNRDYERKNWASVMLINCEHAAWRTLPAVLLEQLQLRFIPDEAIGSLPARWNVLVDEGQQHPDPAVLHYTAGIPGFPHYNDAPYAAEWFGERERVAT